MSQNAPSDQAPQTTPQVVTRIGVTDYMQERVDGQIAYFNRKSSNSQSQYKKINRIEFYLASSIPVLVSLSTMEIAKKAVFGHIQDAEVNLDLIFQIIAAIAGIVMAILNKLMDLENYLDLWKTNRANCEAIEHERYMFLTRTGDYDAPEPTAFAKFVDKIESIINNDVQKWKQKDKVEQQTIVEQKAKNKKAESDNEDED
jgi:hypothetical protein